MAKSLLYLLVKEIEFLSKAFANKYEFSSAELKRIKKKFVPVVINFLR